MSAPESDVASNSPGDSPELVPWMLSSKTKTERARGIARERGKKESQLPSFLPPADQTVSLFLSGQLSSCGFSPEEARTLALEIKFGPAGEVFLFVAFGLGERGEFLCVMALCARREALSRRGGLDVYIRSGAPSFCREELSMLRGRLWLFLGQMLGLRD